MVEFYIFEYRYSFIFIIFHLNYRLIRLINRWINKLLRNFKEIFP